MSGVFELPVLIAAGSAAAPYCKQLAEKVKEFVLKRAGEEVDERVFRKGEKAEFENGLEDLADLLESVARNPAVDDKSVKNTLDGLGKSIKVAADAKYTEGRKDALDSIEQRKNNLILALVNVTSAREYTRSAGGERQTGQGGIETLYTYEPNKKDSFLGKGAFSSVYKMRNKGDGQLFAVKLTQIGGAITLEKLREEAVRLHSLRHDNIVQYITSFYPFKDGHDYFAIVMEHLTGGSLKERLEVATGPFTRDKAHGTAKWACQVASALAHMHAQRMQHRDLKPDNVLFNGAGDAKVIDLGLAVVIKIKLRQSSVGAPLYSSPEKATEKRSYDAKDDVWALGCMLAAAVTGTTLEARHDKGGSSLSKSRKNVDKLVRESRAVSREFGDLVAAMLKWKQEERPTAESLEESLASLEKLLEKPLSLDDVTVEGTRDTSTMSMLKRCFGCRIFGCGMKRIDLSKLALVRTLEGHSSFVNCVAISPDGRRVVSCDGNSYTGKGPGVVKVWDVATGECVATLEGHSRAVRSVAISPDGRRVVSGSYDNTLRVWDVATGKCVATLDGHSEGVTAVAVIPRRCCVSGRRVVSGSHDKTLKVWDLATGECVATLKGHWQSVRGVAVFPDGRRVVSGSSDNTLKVWDVATGKCVATLEGHSERVWCVAVFPDGRRVVSASWDKTLKVWDVATGECVATLEGHSRAVNCVAISRDGRRVVSGSLFELKVWDVATGECVATLEGHSDWVQGVAAFPDGRHVVSASDDGTLKLYAC